MDLYVCNLQFKPIALIEDYSSLVWTDRYTKHGDCKVVFDMDSPDLDHIEKDLYFSFTPSDSHMIIESLVTDYEKGTVTVVARCLKTVFERRLNRQHVIGDVHEEESAAGAATKSVTQNCVTCPVEDRFTNFVIGDHFLPWGGGPNSTRDNGAKDVYSEIVSIVDEALVGWKMEFRSSYTYSSGRKVYDKLVFHCYVGSDRTIGNTEGRGAVIFDPVLDNISDVSVVDSFETWRNVIGVRWGRSGQGWTYVVRAGYRTDNYNINRRVALYTPEMDLGDVTGEEQRKVMTAYGRAEGDRLMPIKVMDGTMLSDGPFEYGWDYFLGDKVTIGYDKKTRQSARVIEYIWSNDANGWSHYPTFKIVDE